MDVRGIFDGARQTTNRFFYNINKIQNNENQALFSQIKNNFLLKGELQPKISLLHMKVITLIKAENITFCL